MTEENKNRDFYRLIKTNLYNNIDNDFKIVMERNLRRYALIFFDDDTMTSNELVRQKEIPISVFKIFDIFYNNNSQDKTWNKVIFTFNRVTESCQLEYLWDEIIENQRKSLKESIEKNAWRDKFDRGEFQSLVYSDLVNNKGIDEEVADYFLSGVLSRMGIVIEEKWLEVYLNINSVTNSFSLYYIDLEGQRNRS
jgi:hypothetical protein